MEEEHHLVSVEANPRLIDPLESVLQDHAKGDASALARCQQMIIELHETEFNGRLVTESDMAPELARLGFRQFGRWPRTHALERPR